MNILNLLFLLFANIGIYHASNNILELDDRIIDHSKQGKWIVSFYAPWCGHCKHLEPVYQELAKHYLNSDVHVAKVDATRFHEAASHFDVRGYPTIKFISDGKVYNYNGERSKNSIIQFIEKADGPKVRKISSEREYLDAKSHKKHFFILLIESQDDNSELRKNFNQMANAHFTEAYFYECSVKTIIEKYYDLDDLPSVYTVKEERDIKFNGNDVDSLRQFMKKEQFLTFTPVTMTNLHKLIESKKTLLIYLEDKSEKNDAHAKKVIKALKNFSEKKREEYYNNYQFGFTDNVELLNGIAIWSLKTPVLFILNTTNFKYALVYFENTTEPSESDFENVLSNLNSGKIEFYGGDGYLNRLRRPFWELYRALLETFIEAPIISLLVFGLPFGVISAVCYCICCCESLDSDEQEKQELESESSENEQELQQQQIQQEDKKTI